MPAREGRRLTVPGSRRRGFEIRRVYDEPTEDGSYRALVDRLWPRGVAKADAHVDEWAKDAAPSTELRRWYGHDPAKFEQFRRRYQAELTQRPGADVVSRLRTIVKQRPVTLLTATKDVEHSGASVLLGVLDQRSR